MWSYYARSEDLEIENNKTLVMVGETFMDSYLQINNHQ